MSPEVPPQRQPEPQYPGRRPRLNWLLLFAVLFGPLIVTTLLVLSGNGRGDLLPTVVFFGGVASGIVGGLMLGRHLGRTQEAKIGWSIALILTLVIVCVTMNAFGCLVSGYQADFR